MKNTCNIKGSLPVKDKHVCMLYDIYSMTEVTHQWSPHTVSKKMISMNKVTNISNNISNVIALYKGRTKMNQRLAWSCYIISSCQKKTFLVDQLDISTYSKVIHFYMLSCELFPFMTGKKSPFMQSHWK